MSYHLIWSFRRSGPAINVVLTAEKLLFFVHKFPMLFKWGKTIAEIGELLRAVTQWEIDVFTRGKFLDEI